MGKGVHSQLELLFDEEFSKVYKFFYYKLQDASVAEDLASESFMRLAEKVKQGEDIEDYKSYLYGICKLVFLERLKEKYESVNLQLETLNYINYVNSTVKVYSNKDELWQLLEKLIRKLPEKQRLIMELRHIQKLSIKETAEKLDKNENYIKTTQKRAFKSLRKLVAETDIYVDNVH